MTVAWAALSAAEVRAVLARLEVETLVELIAYAEALTVPLAGLGVALGTPVGLVEVLIDRALDGRAAWSPEVVSLAGQVRAALRTCATEALVAEARQRGAVRQPWAARLSALQVGDLGGLAEVFHYGAAQAAAFRRDDPAVRTAAEAVLTSLRERHAGGARSAVVDVVIGTRRLN